MSFNADLATIIILLSQRHLSPEPRVKQPLNEELKQRVKELEKKLEKLAEAMEKTRAYGGKTPNN